MHGTGIFLPLVLLSSFPAPAAQVTAGSRDRAMSFVAGAATDEEVGFNALLFVFSAPAAPVAAGSRGCAMGAFAAESEQPLMSRFGSVRVASCAFAFFFF